MNQPRAIFLDMDGTILNHKNQISKSTEQIINDLRREGILVFVATGRTKKEVLDIAPEGFSVDGMVTANGTVVYVGDKKISERTLPYALITKLIDEARMNKIYYEVHPIQGAMITLKQDEDYIKAEIDEPKPDAVGDPEWISRKAAIEKDIAWQSDLAPGSYSKLYFFSREEKQMDEWKEVIRGVKEEMNFTMSSSTKHNVEVMAAGANKATGIQSILDYFNLSADEALAMGDSENDLPMFELVGHTVAMKNAADSIKEVTDEVTTHTCDEEGVYKYLSSCFNVNPVS